MERHRDSVRSLLYPAKPGIGDPRQGRHPLALGAETALAWLAAAILFPITFALGGTLPALLRSAVREVSDTARQAGRIAGANTAGSVVGVGARFSASVELRMNESLAPPFDATRRACAPPAGDGSG